MGLFLRYPDILRGSENVENVDIHGYELKTVLAS
jgi:hypothetical protein